VNKTYLILSYLILSYLIFNDIERTLTLLSRSHQSLTLNISQTATVMAIEGE